MSDSDRTRQRWALVTAAIFSLAATAGLSAAMTYWWTGGNEKADGDGSADGVVQKVFERLSFLDEPDREPEESTTHDATEADGERSLYDLPDHGGRLVGEVDGDRVGLPRLEADYQVDVRGDLATVVVRQSFENPSDRTIEPVYEFPLYAEAAVYGMTMQVGDRRVEANIERKKKAREEYEQAKSQGKKAALLSQDRPNLFTQRVANVEPGQRVVVTLRYTHPVPKSQGDYQLTVPLAVPDRYAPGDMTGNRLVEGDGAEDPGASPGGTDGKEGGSGFDNVDLSVRLDGGMPIERVESISHRVRVDRYSEADRWIELASRGKATDRHFRLAYRLSGDDTRLATHSYWSSERDRGYFDLLIEPPAEVAAESVPNREMVFVIDGSGSMEGSRFRAARKFVQRAMEHLRPSDRLRIIVFSNETVEFPGGGEGFDDGEAPRATPETLDRADAFLREIDAGGGTEMTKAVRAALAPATPEETMRLVTFVTDVKVSNEFEVIELIREHVGGARMFALGVGGDVNRYLLEEIGRAGRGFSEQFELGEGMEQFIDQSVRRLQTPVLTDVSVDWGGLEPDGVTPRPVPDVFEGGSVRLHGRYETPGTHDIEVSGELAGEPVTFERTVEFADSPNSGEAVRLAWARRRIEDAMHQLNTPRDLRDGEVDDETLKEQVTEVGLEHSLTTQWTSFVAVADEPAAPPGEETARGSAPPAQPTSAAKTKSAKKKRVKKQRAPQTKGGSLGTSGRARSGSSRKTKKMGAKAAGIGKLGGSNDKGMAEAFEDIGDKNDQRPVVMFKEPTVDGSLDREIVRKVVRQHRRELKYCYEKELQRDSGLAGRLVVEFTIAASGEVVAVTGKESSLDNRAVEECVRDKARRWTFPSPSDQKNVKVTYPVEFETN